ncbi:hypothetical protein NDU88_004145 [Pleurodeles waltl]|uniref:Uncharacterized protein n=1 Tax=Pleurodeles waltl TaxID=8319 RepID=A0AAV7V0H2_PLEWA|nr:hypothetical protein NDU88_004145 [Pleurodeles waltl]
MRREVFPMSANRGRTSCGTGRQTMTGAGRPHPKKGMRSAVCAIMLRPRVKNIVQSCPKRREKGPGPFSPFFLFFFK